jgi:hypothetical protein
VRLRFSMHFVLKWIAPDRKEYLMLMRSSERVVNRPDPVRDVVGMYAIKLTTNVYHLVQRGGQDTFCGLRVSRVSSERNAGGLQMVGELPATKKVCKHCDRIKSQDDGN